jgi:hypothetical protein
MGFGGISIWQILILLILFIIPVVVFGPVAKKAGYSRWWSLTMIIPLVNLIMLWVFAFVKWPNEQD